MHRLRLACSLLLVLALSACRQSVADFVPGVIPRPQEAVFYADTCLHPDRIRREKGYLGPEDYTLRIRRNGILIAASGEAGYAYALQTLAQLREAGPLHVGTITDRPRYGWRGLMLDEARHFSGKERVKLLLDEMARLKLNRFHWHLTDAQGWRIEIKAYPNLTGTGAVGNHSDPDAPALYYTQEDIREIVAYAAERHIAVIPEIDMPGHASAACRSYPQYAGGDAYGFTFNPGKEETYTFLTDILREVAGLFPAPWLHIGGDEVSYGSEAWTANPDIRALMQREDLADIKAVERYFMHRMADSVKVLGKTLIAWDDAYDVGIGPQGEIIDWWRHDRPDKLRRLAAADISTILCPRRPLYFDFIQDSTHVAGREWDGFNTLDDVYGFPENRFSQWELTDNDLVSVLGIQANLWTETTQNTDRVDFMIFPRICALAEAAWTLPEHKDFPSFRQRLDREYARYDALGIYYFDERDPARHPEPAGPVVLPQKPISLYLHE